VAEREFPAKKSVKKQHPIEGEKRGQERVGKNLRDGKTKKQNAS